MRIEKNGGITKYYLYRTDLEKFNTKKLINILRKLRMYYARQDWDWWETTPIKDPENTWTEYAWAEGGSKMVQDQYYTMIWMVKSVLSTREHVVTSKAEKKKIRQQKAKNRNDRTRSTYWKK